MFPTRLDVADVHAVIEPLWHRGLRTPHVTTRAYAMACLTHALCRTAVAPHTSHFSFRYFPGGSMLFELIKKGTLVATAMAAIAASTTAAAWTAPDFPRIGGIQIGSPFNYNDPNYQAQIAKQSVTVLNDYLTFAPGGMSMQTVATKIKAINPNALLFVYSNVNEMSPSAALGTASWGSYRTAVNQMKWWLYSDKNLTQQVNSSFGIPAINTTLFTPKNSSGQIWMDWAANYYYTNYAKPAPALDGLYMDNLFTRPYIDGDWNRDGIVDSQTDPTVQTWFRQGYAHYYATLKALMPGKYQLGNVGDWGTAANTLTEYQGMINGGIMEGYIGKSWSVEAWGGWAATLAQYRKVMGALAAPKLGIFNVWGSKTDYQGMRYGLGTCLLDDGYFAFTDTTAGYYGVVWFDELDQNLGSGQAKPTAAWQKGVWRRDFDNGIALVNPKGNGVQTVTLETSYLKIKGTQDPAINNGQTVTTVTLQDRDGIILLRPNPVTRPGTPSGFSVEH